MVRVVWESVWIDHDGRVKYSKINGLSIISEAFCWGSSLAIFDDHVRDTRRKEEMHLGLSTAPLCSVHYVHDCDTSPDPKSSCKVDHKQLAHSSRWLANG